MSINIVLHVGTEKTGSTSIQHTLYDNRKALKEMGYLMPLTLGYPCHIHLTACALESEPTHSIRSLLKLTDQDDFRAFREKTLADLKAEISGSDYHTLLITDEHANFHLVKPGLIEAFKEALDSVGDVCKVILYLRRQDELRMSLYSEAVKAGNLTSFDPDNPIVPFKIIPNRFNYLRVLNRLSETFGLEAITPRVFRRDEFVGGDVILDYLSVVGISADLIDRSSIQSNPSLDAKAIWAMSKITKCLKESGRSESEGIRQHMLARVQKAFQGKGPKMRASFHHDFLSRFESMNEEIKEIYFSDRNAPLFKSIEQDKADEESKYYPECSYSVQELTEELTRRESENYGIS